MFYSILLAIIGVSQQYSLYTVQTEPALLKDSIIVIRVRYAEYFQMSCDDYPQYQFESDSDNYFIELTQEQRIQAGCSDSKFVLGIPPNRESRLYITFSDNDYHTIQEFVLNNQDLLPQIKQLNNNTPMLYNDYSRNQKMHYQIDLNQRSKIYAEVNTCYDKFTSFKLTTINDGKEQTYEQEKEYRLIIDSAINPTIQIELTIDDPEYSNDPKFVIKYQYFPQGTLIPYDKFVFPTSFTQQVVDNQLIIQVPKITPISKDQKYSFIQIIALFTTEQNINLVPCIMGDSQIHHYYFWAPQLVYQLDQLDFTTLKFKQNKNQLNYVYLYGIVFVGDIQITQAIGGQTFYLDQASENLDFPIWLLVLILIAVFSLGIVAYLIWKKQKNEQKSNTPKANITDYLQP